MKKTYLLILIVMLTVVDAMHVNAQHVVVNQVVVGSGGVYGDTTDFVTVASFNPGNGITTTFGSVLTESIQDIAISDKYAFVAAQDSIAKFNIDTYEKVAAVGAMGVNRLLVNDGVLIASFQYPVTENFVKVYSAEDLAFISNVSDVSDESAGLLVVGNLAYAAVPGGWASTVGKIAIIDLADYSLVDEINFDTLGKGINDLFHHESQIMSVNKTPWGGSTGCISVMNMLGSHTESHLINETIGKMAGLKDNMLYTIMNGGIGSIDLTDFSVADTAVVEAPALTIAGVALDTLNDLFYVATTDYFSTGLGTIYNIDGEETGNFEAGISPEAIAIDYRDNTGIHNLYSVNEIRIYPNPASGLITVEAIDGTSANKFKVVDISGRMLMNGNISLKTDAANIDVNMLESGLYFLVLFNNNEQTTSPFVKK